MWAAYLVFQPDGNQSIEAPTGDMIGLRDREKSREQGEREAHRGFLASAIASQSSIGGIGKVESLKRKLFCFVLF